MALPRRLSGSSMFQRPENEQQMKPNRIVFLAVEGNETEPHYLRYVDKYRETLKISSLVHIEVLKRLSRDTMSDPDHVLELLEEYLNVRNNGILPEELQNVIGTKYSAEFIRAYLDKTTTLADRDRRAFEKELQIAEIDLAYLSYLNEYKSDDDVFGIVIDRDAGGRAKEQMQRIVDHCDKKGYRCIINSPCFEFWLLLHLTDIKSTYPNSEEEFFKNKKVSARHTYTSLKVSQYAHHAKDLPESKFRAYYLPKIDYAIEQAQKFATQPAELIEKIGSNMGDLFAILKQES